MMGLAQLLAGQLGQQAHVAVGGATRQEGTISVMGLAGKFCAWGPGGHASGSQRGSGQGQPVATVECVWLMRSSLKLKKGIARCPGTRWRVVRAR